VADPAYSGTPLATKLGIKAGARILAIDQPPDYRAALDPIPPDVEFVPRLSSRVDIIHLFVTRRTTLARELKRLRSGMRPDAAVWVSWPKKSAKVPSDITEDVIRAEAVPMGLVDVKVCAVTETWSGLRLVVRKELR
jgi:hypothetical protein